MVRTLRAIEAVIAGVLSLFQKYIINFPQHLYSDLSCYRIILFLPLPSEKQISMEIVCIFYCLTISIRHTDCREAAPIDLSPTNIRSTRQIRLRQFDIYSNINELSLHLYHTMLRMHPNQSQGNYILTQIFDQTVIPFFLQIRSTHRVSCFSNTNSEVESHTIHHFRVYSFSSIIIPHLFCAMLYGSSFLILPLQNRRKNARFSFVSRKQI